MVSGIGFPLACKEKQENMKKISLLLLFTFAVVCMQAQDVENAEPLSVAADRPGMATGVGVLPFKAIQWETGFQWDYADRQHAFTLPTTMLRFGVAPFAELRLEYDGTLSQTTELNTTQWKYQVEPLILGTKIRIFDGWKAVPKISFLANVAIPITKQQFQTTHLAPSLYLLFENDVTDWLNLCYNVGAEWNGVDAAPSTFLALCLGFNINDQWGAFVESYNYFTRQTNYIEIECNLDAGFTYMPHHRVQLDVYASINCQDPAKYSNVGLGVAWLINP